MANHSKLAESLMQAIQAERDGNSFYGMAAAASRDPKAKEIFAQLAVEELDHMQFLSRQYDSILKTGKPDPTAKLGSRHELGGLSPIFSADIKLRIKDAHFEMSALSIGIQLEVTAENFYRARAAEADNPEIRGFFLQLADWEAGHYQALLCQHDALKEDYWSANRFSAF
jgi:rubrerythrin